MRHHYDVSDEFFALFLDASMTYSCAIFSRGATTLEEAQETKLELVCTKLGLRARRARARRRLRLGQLRRPRRARPRRPRHRHHAVARRRPSARAARAEEAGVADRVDIRVQDYRELAGERFDAIASIGMVEHVGNAQIDAYAAAPARAAASPAGALLNHGIARLRHGDPEAGPFSERYVFPDAAPLHVGADQPRSSAPACPPTTSRASSRLRRDAAPLGHAPRREPRRGDRLAGPERMRVWRLYLRAARAGFETGFTSIYQVRAAPTGVVLAARRRRERDDGQRLGRRGALARAGDTTADGGIRTADRG